MITLLRVVRAETGSFYALKPVGQTKKPFWNDELWKILKPLFAN
jgi:hypothetical protein